MKWLVFTGSLFFFISGAHSENAGIKLASLNYSPSTCQKTFTKQSDGTVVASVNCGLGQTCADGETCCRLGSSVSCCTSSEQCVEGMCESK
jgi:hypothetical protein